MISIAMHHTNSVTLQGNDLEPYHSRIALFTDGWSIRLVWCRGSRRACRVQDNLSREAVIPTIRELLLDYRDETDMNEGEINYYLDVIVRDMRRFKLI